MLTVSTAIITVAAVELSVDELAARSGASVRTIRWYQSEGLLPAPERHGREARYGAEHVERLEAISTLQDRGLRLSAIAELLTGEGSDDDVAGWLGLGQSLVRPWSEDEPVLLGEAELQARVGEVSVEALVAGGLVERRADTSPVVYLVPSPGLLDVALELAALGIDLGTAAALRELLEHRLRALATDLVAEFTDRVSLGHLAGEGPAALTELIDALQPVARRSVDLVFAHEMERAQRALLDAAVAATQEDTA
jgi:DNA-binding transcriptional MerR regulator